MKNSKSNEYLIGAFEKGYRVINGAVISPFSGKPLKLSTKTLKCGYVYKWFTVRSSEGLRVVVKVHRLVAYQKFGEEMFKSKLQVRHLDGNSLNNKNSNIAIGTASENALDKSPEIRMKVAINASAAGRKFSDSKMREVKEYHAKYKSYAEVMEKFNISSKGTLHYILNHNYVTSA
jgi:hypothetical protein